MKLRSPSSDWESSFSLRVSARDALAHDRPWRPNPQLRANGGGARKPRLDCSWPRLASFWGTDSPKSGVRHG